MGGDLTVGGLFAGFAGRAPCLLAGVPHGGGELVEYRFERDAADDLVSGGRGAQASVHLKDGIAGVKDFVAGFHGHLTPHHM
jgi:hypothetical protein